MLTTSKMSKAFMCQTILTLLLGIWHSVTLKLMHSAVIKQTHRSW